MSAVQRLLCRVFLPLRKLDGSGVHSLIITACGEFAQTWFCCGLIFRANGDNADQCVRWQACIDASTCPDEGSSINSDRLADLTEVVHAEWCSGVMPAGMVAATNRAHFYVVSCPSKQHPLHMSNICKDQYPAHLLGTTVGLGFEGVCL